MFVYTVELMVLYYIKKVHFLKQTNAESRFITAENTNSQILISWAHAELHFSHSYLQEEFHCTLRVLRQ